MRHRSETKGFVPFLLYCSRSSPEVGLKDETFSVRKRVYVTTIQYDFRLEIVPE